MKGKIDSVAPRESNTKQSNFGDLDEPIFDFVCRSVPAVIRYLRYRSAKQPFSLYLIVHSSFSIPCLESLGMAKFTCNRSALLKMIPRKARRPYQAHPVTANKPSGSSPLIRSGPYVCASPSSDELQFGCTDGAQWFGF